MRVTQNTTANLVTNNLQTIRKRTEELQQQASTGYKVTMASDDPVTAQQILHMKSLMASGDQYARNISNGIAWLTMSEGAMSELGNVITRAKELTVAMSSETNNDSSRQAAVNEFEELKAQVITLGNTQLNGKYIFGGFKNDTPPFDSSGNFLGTDDAISVEVDHGSFVQMNYSGGELIRGTGGGTDIIATLDNIIAALNSNDTSGVEAELSNLDDALGQVLATRTDLGARLTHLNSANTMIDNMNLSLTKITSDKQDADMIQVISDLSKQQTAYEAAVAAAAKISQISLLDYLS